MKRPILLCCTLASVMSLLPAGCSTLRVTKESVIASDSISGPEKPTAQLEELPLSPRQAGAAATGRSDPQTGTTERSSVSTREQVGKGSNERLRSVATMMAKNGNYTIDLANALALAGASHLQVQMARQGVLEAQARLLRAQSNWLPSLRLGIGWNKHDGRLQATQGNVVESGRNSVWVGGGAGMGQYPLAGGSSGPVRMMINLSLADILFERAVEAQMLNAADANATAVTQDALRDVAVAYFELVEAHALRANAREAQKWHQLLLALVQKFANAGAGSLAEVDRATSANATARQRVADADRLVQQHSVALARLIRLDVVNTLSPVEDKVMPVSMVDPHKPVADLIAIALANRPEISRQEAVTAALSERIQQAQWRPWLPNVIAGASAGTFGGGPATTFENQGSRSDIDLAAYWELTNVGLGNRAERQERSSQWRQSQLREQWLSDQVAADVAAALANVKSYEQQISIARGNVKAAVKSFQRNYQRVLESEGLPLELLQAIQARIQALDQYTRAVGQYNRAQFQLLHAVGQLKSTGNGGP